MVKGSLVTACCEKHFTRLLLQQTLAPQKRVARVGRGLHCKPRRQQGISFVPIAADTLLLMRGNASLLLNRVPEGDIVNAMLDGVD